MTQRSLTSAMDDGVELLLRELESGCLRPQAEAVAEAKRRADRLIQELHLGDATMFKVLGIHDHGSLSRGTGIRHFNDLDRLVELDGETLRTRTGTPRTARDTISRMARYISQRRGGLISLGSIEVRTQDHSVGILYPQRKLRLDLVPGVLQGGQLYIPERGTQQWIPTNPALTARRLQEAKAAAPHTGIAIRLLKGWSRARGRNAPIPSFAIETLVVDMVHHRPRPLGELVRDFLQDIAGLHAGRRLVLGAGPLAPTPVAVWDPVSGNNLTQEMRGDQRVRLVKSCRTGLQRLDQLAQLVSHGRQSEATTAAKNLFVGRAWQ